MAVEQQYRHRATAARADNFEVTNASGTAVLRYCRLNFNLPLGHPKTWEIMPGPVALLNPKIES